MSSNARIDTGSYIEVNILNCGHIVTCLDYNLQTITCPYCRSHIVRGTKITFGDYNMNNLYLRRDQ